MRTKSLELTLSRESLSDFYNIVEGVFAPLSGFMTAKDYESVVDDMRLSSGEVWTIPITLEVPEADIDRVIKSGEVILQDPEGRNISKLLVEDIFKVDHPQDLVKVFGTDSLGHSGVVQESRRSTFLVGGRVESISQPVRPKDYFSPAETRKLFAQQGWRTIAGFQTRNPIHRAHEYLQRTALDLTDGIFIQPLIGWKNKGDFSHHAVMASYNYMVKQIYPINRVVLGTLETPMRYAGPREAVFHAIIRKNYGCTHFIVGRDHAGVGEFYGKYDAHKLINSLYGIGIEVLTLHEPYYCIKCGNIVTQKNCKHKNCYEPISGSMIRQSIRNYNSIPSKYIREEVYSILTELNRKGDCFIE